MKYSTLDGIAGATPKPRFERRRLRVYIAGPISRGDTFENVIRGIRWGRRMLVDGLAPYVPHLDAYMTLSAGGETSGEGLWNSLLEWDLEWVAASEALFRLEGSSKGADLEVAAARDLGKPVFFEKFWQGDPKPASPNLVYLDLKEYADLHGLRSYRRTNLAD